MNTTRLFRLLATLDAGGAGWREACRATGIPRPTLFRALRRLELDFEVVLVLDGQGAYSITDWGVLRRSRVLAAVQRPPD